ncbi:hypothetical protein ACFLYU_00210 [Candidatus Dependentiae bacterium]
MFSKAKLLPLALILLFGACQYTHAQTQEKTPQKRYKVGLLIVATGKYIQFVEPLVKSADIHFLPNHDVTYFVFTNKEIPKHDNIIKIHQDRLGWPYDTMMRYEMYYNAKELLENMDYLFACDADMLFVDTVSDEILGEQVGTIHPGFYNKKGTYETRKSSTACVKPNEAKHYFAGGFNGGSSKEFLKRSKKMSENIYKDLEENIVAVWHDESHLNRYFIDNPPTVILTPSYCYPERWKLPFHKRLLALDKNHSQMRK